MVGDVIRVFKKMADGVLLFQTVNLVVYTYIRTIYVLTFTGLNFCVFHGSVAICTGQRLHIRISGVLLDDGNYAY